MNYERFLERRARWDAFSARLDQLDAVLSATGKRRRGAAELEHEELEGVVLDYRKTLSDFALARSRFPDTWASRHLAQLVTRANHRLRADQDSSRTGLLGFYRNTFPRLFQEMSTEVMVCVALFLIAVLLGFGLSTLTPEAGAAFLGPDAMAGLERGEIWLEGIGEGGSLFSAAIARNNMKVAMTAWAGGLLAGVGSLFIVFFNGLMLGVIVATTVHFAMQGALFEFISAHGPLELTLILVAGAAGLHMGRAIVGDSDRPRAERIGTAARTSLFVMLGCLPFFLTLGFVEGYISPASGLSIELKLAVGLALELAFLGLVLRPLGKPVAVLESSGDGPAFGAEVAPGPGQFMGAGQPAGMGQKAEAVR